MATSSIAQNQNQRNPFKECRTCGYTLSLAFFDLVNHFSLTDTRRIDDCNCCNRYLREKRRLEQAAIDRSCPIKAALRNEVRRQKVNARESKRRTKKLLAMPI